MRIAFVFPGQCLQFIGMLNDFKKYKIVKDIIQETSDILHKDIENLITVGSYNELNLIINSQPIILMSSYAIFCLWKIKYGIDPIILAGHSLGEYTAFVVSGAIKFCDAISLVYFRSKLIQDFFFIRKGCMAVIFDLDIIVINKICKKNFYFGLVEIACFNSINQTVISGDVEAVNEVCRIIKVKYNKYVKLLPINIPFHSSLLKPILNEFKSYLESIKIHNINIPVFSCILSTIVDNPVIVRYSLLKSIVSPVYWIEFINYAINNNIKYIIECGTVKILSNLMRYYKNSFFCLSLNNLKAFKKCIKIISI